MSETDMTDIVIVTHNRLEFTNRTLKHLHERTRSPFRLIIVDNGSTDGTRDVLNAIPAPHKVILLPENKGLEVAKNVGLEQVETEFYVDSDNDILVPDLDGSDWLERLHYLINQYPRFAAIAMRPQILVGVGAIFRSDKEVVENNVAGASMRIMRTELVRKVGAWRDRFTNDSEEWHISGELQKAGFKVGYARDLFCYHLFGNDRKWGYGGEVDRRHGDRTCNYTDDMFQVDEKTFVPKFLHNE